VPPTASLRHGGGSMVDFRTRILIVEDDARMRRAIRLMLKNSGFVDIEEDDGQDPMAVLLTRRFGLILSDLKMEPFSGLDLLKRVRDEPKLADIPFIMITGASEQPLVQSALSLGVNGYIVKPFDATTLLRKISSVLSQARAPAARSRSGRDGTADP
jgi:two-component system, chemotaxis family, chemotaxis protein CheY